MAWHIAIVEPWGSAPYNVHFPEAECPLPGARLVLVARWDNGYLQPGGVGRIYIDPASIVIHPASIAGPMDPGTAQQIDQNFQALESNVTKYQLQMPSNSVQDASFQKLETEYQLPESPRLLAETLLTYIFKGFSGGTVNPLQIFQNINTWHPTIQANIAIKTYSDHTSPTTEQERIEVEVTALAAGPNEKYGGMLTITLKDRTPEGGLVRRYGDYTITDFRRDLYIARGGLTTWLDCDLGVEFTDEQGGSAAEFGFFDQIWPAHDDGGPPPTPLTELSDPQHKPIAAE